MNTDPEQHARLVVASLCDACDAIEEGGIGIVAPLTIHNPYTPTKKYVLASEAAWNALTGRKEQS